MIKEIHYKQTRYSPNGSEDVELVFDVSKETTSFNMVAEMNNTLFGIEKAKAEIRKLKEQEFNDTMMASPQTRLEHLRYQKLKLEEATRGVSAEIMQLEEQIRDKEEKG